MHARRACFAHPQHLPRLMPWTVWFMLFEAASTKPNFSAVALFYLSIFGCWHMVLQAEKLVAWENPFLSLFPLPLITIKALLVATVIILLLMTTSQRFVFLEQLNSSQFSSRVSTPPLCLLWSVITVVFLWQFVIEMEECEEDMMSTFLLCLGTYGVVHKWRHTLTGGGGHQICDKLWQGGGGSQ